MDSLINDIQQKVAKYVTASEAIENAIILTRKRILLQIEDIMEDCNEDSENFEEWVIKFTQRFKNLNTNHKLSERGMADASSSNEFDKSANNDLCKCGHNKDIHSPLAQDICLIYLGNGYACDCKHFERSNIK